MRISAVYSPIGGVGKTVFATALGYEFSARKKRTLLVDCATFGALRFLLRQDKEKHGMPYLHTLFSSDYVKKNDIKLKKELFENGIVMVHKEHKLMLLPSASPVKMEALTYAQVQGLMRCLRDCGYDEVIIDMSSDLHLRNIAILEAVDRIYLLQSQNLQDAIQIEGVIGMMKDLYIETHKITHILSRVNMRIAYNKDEVSNYLNCKFAATIPDFKHALTSEMNTWDKAYLSKGKDVLQRYRKHLRGIV